MLGYGAEVVIIVGAKQLWCVLLLLQCLQNWYCEKQKLGLCSSVGRFSDESDGRAVHIEVQ